MPPNESKPPLLAYETNEPVGMPIETAPARRDWMDALPERFAYRCLPMMIANQAGWTISCPVDFRVVWQGGPDLDDLLIVQEGDTFDPRISSNFGHGILTFSIPYVFRTPSGVNLWAKGPANCFKDGATALEGIIETDWAISTFTMNWKLTRPGHVVRFSAGEPICMVLPVERGFIEQFDPQQCAIATDPELEHEYVRWRDSRTAFNKGLREQEPAIVKQGWEKDYFQGEVRDGEREPSHQSKLKLQPFRRV